MAKKSNRIFVKLFSAAGTGYYYTFSRKRTAPKMEMCKYDPRVRQHVLFFEGKPTLPQLNSLPSMQQQQAAASTASTTSATRPPAI